MNPPLVQGQFTLPIYIDLSATLLYAMTGALLAIRRHYDVVGLFVLALVSGVGGGLIRDGIFIQSGPPVAMSDRRYLLAILAGCALAALFRKHLDRLQKVFLFADALGFGCYAVVGVERALNHGLSAAPAIMIGVITAAGGGLLRDVLVRDEPLLFKPGQLYVLAALLGASLFALLTLQFKKPAESAALLAIGCSFIFRVLAIVFNWKTVPMSERFLPVSITFSSATDSQSNLSTSERPNVPQTESFSITPNLPPPVTESPSPGPSEKQNQGNLEGPQANSKSDS
jgi:uncharacterized membrane protein YeiH